jgi:hypothetical protein
MDYLKAFKKYISEDLDNIDDKEAKTKFKNLKDKDIDNDGDVDDSDSYLHNRLSNVAKNVDEEEELEEMSTTASVPGYQTPMAFGDGSAKSKKKQKDNAENSTDNELVKDTNKHSVKLESMYKRIINQMEDLNEVSYREYKKDPTSTPQQKVNRGIMEVNKMLGEIEKIVTNNLRLKTETGVQSGHFWKTTGTRFAKINERMLRVANRLKELSQ